MRTQLLNCGAYLHLHPLRLAFLFRAIHIVGSVFRRPMRAHLSLSSKFNSGSDSDILQTSVAHEFLLLFKHCFPAVSPWRCWL